MAQNSPITLPDAQATPVDHVFTPVRIDGDLASYINFAEAASVGRETLSLRCAENSTLRRVTVILKVPRLIVETVNGVDVPSVPDYCTVKCEAMVPRTWTEEEVANVQEMASNLLANSTYLAMATRGEFVY